MARNDRRLARDTGAADAGAPSTLH
jgi:hypothetical protein